MARFMQFTKADGHPVLINIDAMLKAEGTFIDPGRKVVTRVMLGAGVSELLAMPYAEFVKRVGVA
jgi:hypothetical protein